ncbi:PucR family transcriptional regulator [Marinobacter lutaoensis]|jgi:hypothetical protein|uniref:PucR family transcriptional regulator n=1 Tax=Marinobacter lutaoensis TaxID=135739 RepID=A0A1V2DT94_9GAMM|nr:PucR family transcriptional regulator [Marinobacter lutaoensis]MBE02266.1 PucR family transcriptional regulator [Marinobacter sp.]MBI42310.1 PucR family transcriptional regulator [Oceanospirillales bacterium]ONF43787.1 PucR family transcriptional regulator [Marinobacter lutaoensis]|tara:strand:+ start:1534 stop:2259 length:726 start_codon:yes stop_codon:yes gene_type:complete
MVLRCRDIPALPGLDAIRLRGGASGADRPVRWPYVAENRSFRDWVKGGELVFVTGISRHRSPQNLAECLYEGRECGISGLVVLTGDAYIGLLPSRLCQLADELSLPLFEQPYSLPMVDVTEAIGRAIVSAERQDGAARTLADAIVADLGRERLRVLVERYLGEDPAGTDGELLDAWLCHRGNQSLMAEALGCHRNTIRNRLHRLAGPAPGGRDGHEHFKTRLLAHLLLDAEGLASRLQENI